MTLPELHLVDWRPTKDTLHLYAQIIGKIRLATTPARNHWWNAPLYVDTRGLTTRCLHHYDTTFEISVDFLASAFVIETADGRARSFDLGTGVAVADFDARLHAALADLGLDIAIRESPYGVPMTAPEPDGLRDEPLALGEWIPFGAGSIAALPYETVRTAPDPRATLLGFCQSAYEAGARRADWDTTGFASKWCPTAGQLQELQLSAVADLGAPTGA